MLYHAARFALVAALAVWCYQVGQRIRFGDWLWVSLRSMMGGYHLEAGMPWRGGARIVGWILDSPLGWLMVVAGALLLFAQLWRETRIRRQGSDVSGRKNGSQGISPK